MRKILTAMMTLTLASCAQGHCKRGKDTAVADAKKTQQGPIFVFKPDGSKQCQKNSGKSLDAMAKDLEGVKILSKQKKSDGMMRIQVCGADTGMLNIYEIEAAGLQKALDVGFKVWKDPNP